MTLSLIEKQTYLELIISKFNKHSALQSSILFGTDGVILALTEKVAADFGFKDITKCLGISIANLTEEDFIRFGTVDAENITAIKAAYKKIFKLQQIAIAEKKLINFLNLIPRKGEFSTRLINFVPIIHPSGEVVAIQSFGSEFTLFGINEYLNFIQNKYSPLLVANGHDNNLPIKLTIRQYEILFLLATGLSQRQAAEILNISRSTLIKLTTDSICPKFGIYDGNTQALIDKAIELGYDRYIPQSLCRPYVIVLDHDILEKYFMS